MALVGCPSGKAYADEETMGKELKPQEVLADLFEEWGNARPAEIAKEVIQCLTDAGFKIVDWKEAADS
jgi:hypothetical protein